MTDAPYFSTPVTLGPGGVAEVHGYGAFIVRAGRPRQGARCPTSSRRPNGWRCRGQVRGVVRTIPRAIVLRRGDGVIRKIGRPAPRVPRGSAFSSQARA